MRHGAVAFGLTLLVHSFSAAPALAAAGLRTVTCCATVCHHTRLGPTTRCCCPHVDVGDVIAVSPAVNQPHAASIAHLVPAGTGVLRVGGEAGTTTRTQANQRSGPIFLLTRSLRL